jgi:hypothetical protein
MQPREVEQRPPGKGLPLGTPTATRASASTPGQVRWTWARVASAPTKAAIRPYEEVAAGIGDAERKTIDYMLANGIRPIEIAAGRPICPPCAALIEQVGAVAGSPTR